MPFGFGFGDFNTVCDDGFAWANSARAVRNSEKLSQDEFRVAASKTSCLWSKLTAPTEKLDPTCQ